MSDWKGERRGSDCKVQGPCSWMSRAMMGSAAARCCSAAGVISGGEVADDAFDEGDALGGFLGF